jgi:hypothetical protein
VQLEEVLPHLREVYKLLGTLCWSGRGCNQLNNPHHVRRLHAHQVKGGGTGIGGCIQETEGWGWVQRTDREVRRLCRLMVVYSNDLVRHHRKARWWRT